MRLRPSFTTTRWRCSSSTSAGCRPATWSSIDGSRARWEVAYFGLVPDYIGRGLGPCLLGWGLDRAWSYGPRRVWLHTCSLDHPKALSVYRRTGFEVFDRRVEPVETTLLDLARQGRRQLQRL